MPARKRPSDFPSLPGLLNDAPPIYTVDEQPIKAATVKGKWSIAVSRALKRSMMSREEIAKQMSDYLGKPISIDVLNAYASQGRDTHVINLERLEALIVVTQDIELVAVFTGLIDHVPVHKNYAGHVEYARDKTVYKELGQRIKAYEEQWND